MLANMFAWLVLKAQLHNKKRRGVNETLVVNTTYDFQYCVKYFKLILVLTVDSDSVIYFNIHYML